MEAGRSTIKSLPSFTLEASGISKATKATTAAKAMRKNHGFTLSWAPLGREVLSDAKSTN